MAPLAALRFGMLVLPKRSRRLSEVLFHMGIVQRGGRQRRPPELFKARYCARASQLPRCPVSSKTPL